MTYTYLVNQRNADKNSECMKKTKKHCIEPMKCCFNEKISGHY